MTANTAFGVSTPVNSRSINNAFDAVLNNGYDFSNIVATGLITAATFSGSGASLTSLNASNLASGTVPNARISGSYTGITGVGTLTGLTLDGPLSPSMFFGDWNQDNNWSGIRGTHGYLLTGSNGAGNTGIYLRTESNTHPVNIGANNTNTLVVTSTSATVTGTMSATTFSGSGASLTSLPAGNLTGTIASARIAGAYTGFTSITVDGASSSAISLGDWGSNGNYAQVGGTSGYLLVGNNSGDTAMYLRTSTAGVVHIGANGSNTLSVGNGTILQTGNTTLAANNSYQCAALPAFGFNAWAGVSSYNFYNASDIRYKANVKELPLGLDFIKLLDAIEFSYLYPEFGEDNDTPTSITEGTRLRAGLSAQNVKESLNAVGAGDYNFWALADKNNPDSFQALDYTGLVAPIIKAIQELDQRLQQLETI